MPDPFAAAPAADRLRCYGLLYVDRRHDKHVNLRPGKDPVVVYVGCASLLAASARWAGESFTVLTNAASELHRIAAEHGFPPFACKEIAFDLEIPRNIRFYQAHYKLCALDAMASGELGGFTALIDIDAVLLGGLSPRLGGLHGLHAYGIDEGLAEAHLGDLHRLIGHPRGPRRWFGGEFIAGDPAALRPLAAAVKMLLPRYLEAVPTLAHVGDETLVSAALNLLIEAGAAVHDVGPERTVVRWYSSRLRVRQERLAQALDATMLHLPADKSFLQEQARRWRGPERFRQDLMRHVIGKSALRALANPVLSLAEGERKYAPRA